MDFKKASEITLSKVKLREGEKLSMRERGRGSEKSPQDSKESYMLEALDDLGVLRKHADYIDKLRRGMINPQQYLEGVSPEAAIQMTSMALNPETSEKVRLAALQDILDRAGYSKVQKHAIASVDANQPKEQLLSMLEGLNRKSKIIEIEDDEPGQDQDQKK